MWRRDVRTLGIPGSTRARPDGRPTKLNPFTAPSTVNPTIDAMSDGSSARTDAAENTDDGPMPGADPATVTAISHRPGEIQPPGDEPEPVPSALRPADPRSVSPRRDLPTNETRPRIPRCDGRSRLPHLCGAPPGAAEDQDTGNEPSKGIPQGSRGGWLPIGSPTGAGGVADDPKEEAGRPVKPAR